MRRVTLFLGLAMVLAIVAAGCRTVESRSVKESGFLGDYSMLKEGTGDEPLYFYMKPGFDPTKYPAVMIKPVTIWVTANKDMSDIPEKDRQHLADAFYQALHDELKTVKRIVNEPGEGVLEIRAAITDAETSNVVMDSISTILPAGLILSEGVTLATGTAGFAGVAAAEMEVLDSVSGERLVAAVDKRRGGKDFSGLFSSWDDVYGAMEAWAEEMHKRISEKAK